MTPEEIASNIISETQLIDNSWQEARQVKIELMAFITQALREAIAEERIECQRIMCYGCRRNLEYVNGMHKIKDGLVPKNEEYRWTNCTALAIRARANTETT